jgi:hypothetical protein
MWKYYLLTGLAWSAGIHAYAAVKGYFDFTKGHRALTIFGGVAGLALHAAFWPALLPRSVYKLVKRIPISLTRW